MKKLYACVCFLSLCSSAFAGTECKKDWNGVLVCTETGIPSHGTKPYSGGYQQPYRSETKKDWNGYDVTTDNRGNRVECKKDWNGNYVCN